MNYNPRDYLMPDKYGIARASQVAGQTIANIPNLKREKEEYDYKNKMRQTAIEEAEKDWGRMEDAWKVIKTQYTKKAQPLIEKGLMTEDDLNADIKMLRMPTSSDKKNPGDYIDNTAKTYSNLIQKIDQKSRQAGLAEDVSRAARQEVGPMKKYTPPGSVGGEGFQEADVTTRERPVTKQDVASSPYIKEGAYTSQELESNPQFKYMQSQADIEKAKREDEANRLRMERLGVARQKAAREGNDTFYKESEALITDAAQYESAVGRTQKQLSETNGDLAEVENEIKGLSQQLRQISESPDIMAMGEDIEDAKKKLNEAKKRRSNLVREANGLTNDLQNQREKKILAEDALDIYIKTGGRIGFKGALQTGQKGASEFRKRSTEQPSTQGTTTRERYTSPTGNLPPMTTQTVMGETTLPGSTQVYDVVTAEDYYKVPDGATYRLPSGEIKRKGARK